MSRTRLKELRDLLIDEIPLYLQAAKLKKRVCCVRVFFYDTHAPCAYLTLRPIFDSERTTLFSESANAIYEFWAPEEQFGSGPEIDLGGEHEPEYRIEELLNETYASLASDSGLTRYRKMLADVCFQLNQHDWSDEFPMTDDFVFAIADGSLAFDDTWSDLVDSIPKRKLTSLQESEYLGEGDHWDTLETFPADEAEDPMAKLERVEEEIWDMSDKRRVAYCIDQLQCYLTGGTPVENDFGGSFYVEFLGDAKGISGILDLLIANIRIGVVTSSPDFVLDALWAIKDGGVTNRAIETKLKAFVAESYRLNDESKKRHKCLHTCHAAMCLHTLNPKKYPRPEKSSSTNAMLNVEAFC